MHEILDLEMDLKAKAQKISKKFGGAGTIIIVAGNRDAGIKRCMLGSSLILGPNRLRDLLGILETAIQIESLKHWRIKPFNKLPLYLKKGEPPRDKDMNEPTKEDLLDWIEYVNKHISGFVGIEKEKDFFYTCLIQIRSIIEKLD